MLPYCSAVDTAGKILKFVRRNAWHDAIERFDNLHQHTLVPPGPRLHRLRYLLLPLLSALVVLAPPCRTDAPGWPDACVMAGVDSKLRASLFKVAALNCLDKCDNVTAGPAAEAMVYLLGRRHGERWCFFGVERAKSDIVLAAFIDMYILLYNLHNVNGMLVGCDAFQNATLSFRGSGGVESFTSSSHLC